MRTAGLLLICIGVVVLTLKLSRVYDPAPAIERWAGKAGPKATKFIKQVQPDRAVYVALVCLPVGIGALLLFFTSKAKPLAAKHEPVEHSPAAPAWKSARAKPKGAAVHSCNVLQAAVEPRQLWQFDARNGGFVLNRQQVAQPGDPLPSSAIAKDWRSLFQRKLNVAWLPADNVFLRVIQLPLSDFNETLSMVELQLEKLSPLPVAQIVWSIEVLPHSTGNMQSVIVLIVARDVVEEFLGKLEGQGYLADALEIPVLDQLRATPVTEDGAWIYPQTLGGKQAGLAAWWYGGVLHNLEILNLTGGTAGLQEQLTQMAWAGELEGWLTSPPQYHLVAPEGSAPEWEEALQSGADVPVRRLAALAPGQLAAATAQRVAQTADSANLLPAEFSERYKQQFYDRLWMRGLFAVAGLYVIGVVIYMLCLTVFTVRTDAVEKQVSERGPAYTNVIQLRERLKVLKDRSELKFAALDCWRTVAENLPETLALENFGFSDGKKLVLNGTAPTDAIQQIYDFDKAMRRAVQPETNEPLFDPLKGDYPTYQSAQGGNVRWSMSLELKRTDVQ